MILLTCTIHDHFNIGVYYDTAYMYCACHLLAIVKTAAAVADYPKQNF